MGSNKFCAGRVYDMSQCMKFPTMWYVQPAKAQISLHAQSDQSLCSSLKYSMTVKVLTEHLLEVLSLTGGCTGLSESTLVKMPYCWKSHVTAHIMCVYYKTGAPEGSPKVVFWRIRESNLRPLHRFIPYITAS